MNPQTYDPATKQAIIDAAIKARSAGKPWVKALAAVKPLGYRGSEDGLYQLLRAASGAKAKRSGKKPMVTAKAQKPAILDRVLEAAEASAAYGSGPALAAKKESALPPAGAVSSVEQMIEGIVRQRVDAVLGRAIGVLEQAVGELKGLRG